MSLLIAPLRRDDEDTIDAVIALWQACGLTRPFNDPAADVRLALETPNAAVLVGRFEGTVSASVMVGHDGHRGAVYYLGVMPERRGLGFGAAMMAAAEEFLRVRGVPKLNLMVRSENAAVAAFYARLGYAEEERTVLAKRLG